jgi:hypothetical protein
MAVASKRCSYTSGVAMADDLKNRGGRDRKRIDVNKDYELRDWSEKFGVSKDELKEAVRAVVMTLRRWSNTSRAGARQESQVTR